MRKLIKNVAMSIDQFRRPSVRYCVEHNLLPEVLVKADSNTLRSLMFLPESEHRTQLNQDIFALLVNQFKQGFFIEIGANDGYTVSNSIYLEDAFGWDGLLIEANPDYTESLRRRKAKSVIAAVVDVEGEYDFCSAGLYGGVVDSLDTLHSSKTINAGSITVWGTTLQNIFSDNDIPSRVDFVSIDVEGAETSIVKQLCDLKEYRFTCGCVEHNGRQADYEMISNYLTEAGYQIVWEGQTQHDLFFVDRSK